MAWDTTLVTMVRVLINDLGSPPIYSDARLQQLIAVAAIYVAQEIQFPTAYTIDVSVPSITPDPTLTETLDDDYSAFIVLKAACLTDQSTLRSKIALQGIRARLGPAELQIDNSDSFFKMLSAGPCGAYNELKMQYLFGGKGFARTIKAILSPFVSNTFDPMDLPAYPNETRNRDI